MNKITVTILTKNSAKYLAEVLSSLRSFAEIVILDNGSSDNSLSIAKGFDNVRIIEHDFIGFGPLKNLAAGHALNDWILSIDSDEVLTPGLIEELNNLSLDPSRIYAIPRDNYYNQKLMHCCGWEGDQVKRLYHRKTCRFSEQQVHESLVATNVRVVLLKNSLSHYSFDCAEELIDKMQHYSTLYARDYEGKKKTTPMRAFARGIFAFFKYYVLQKGFLNGAEGLLIAVSNANGVFYKYMKLYEINRIEKSGKG